MALYYTCSNCGHAFWALDEEAVTATHYRCPSCGASFNPAKVKWLIWKERITTLIGWPIVVGFFWGLGAIASLLFLFAVPILISMILGISPDIYQDWLAKYTPSWLKAGMDNGWVIGAVWIGVGIPLGFLAFMSRYKDYRKRDTSRSGKEGLQ